MAWLPSRRKPAAEDGQRCASSDVLPSMGAALIVLHEVILQKRVMFSNAHPPKLVESRLVWRDQLQEVCIPLMGLVALCASAKSRSGLCWPPV